MTNDNSQELEVSPTPSAGLSLTQGSGQVVSTVDTSTMEGKVRQFDALQDAQPVAHFLGKKIELVDIIMQSVEIADSQTGELNPAVRVILVDKDGQAYSSVSETIVKDVRTLLTVFGAPREWGGPLVVKVEERQGRPGHKFYKLLTA